MTGQQKPLPAVTWIRWRKARLLTRLTLAVAVAMGNAQGGDLLRRGAPVSSLPASAATADSSTPAATPPAALGNIDRLARTTKALAAVQQMQNAARNLAIAGSNSLRAGLPAVPVNSYQQANGLVIASGANKLWSGANQPVATTQTTGGTTTSNVTVTQTQQQALLTWESFNIGKNTTLTFDQGAGGTNVSQWIAFNYVRDHTGNPTQILGTIRTIGAPDSAGAATVGGQVYVMNSNGIIFGGSSQVNTHALVASSLPINSNLIQSGLLNNPDAQFLFSALPLPAGSKGPTPGFDPAVAVDGVAPVQTPLTADGAYGDVIVQPGAILTAPTSADHVGGRIALVGPNVTNAGTISTADGQTILAAGLQVGFAPHNKNDPTLRGLDVFVGQVADDSLPDQPAAGSASNAGLDNANLGLALTGVNSATTNPSSLNVLGLISAPRGNVYVTGQTIDQSGLITSSTSVAYNGRVDLVAGYNAVGNPNAVSTDQLYVSPFLYRSNVGDSLTGDPMLNSGAVTLGRDSVIQIMPETDSTDRVVGDLALPTQVNIQGQSVHFVTNATLLAPGAAVPVMKAYSADGSPLTAGVSIQAGSWFYPGSVTLYRMVQSADDQQIYFDSGATIDVAGMSDVSASVTENIVAVELRGSELANSPLQRDGPLRGQTIQVDIRKHGAWDPTLNGGLGGYTWVGTPLADTSGWVGLTTHSVGELSVNGGSVTLKAGGAVVLQEGAVVDVSGGSIAYQGGYTQTTRLTGGDGHVYDISKATPDHVYAGIYSGTTTKTDPKWGITTTSTSPLVQKTFEAGYVQGGSGGSLAIASSVLALDGTLRANTVSGPAQLTLSPVYNPSNPPDPTNPKSLRVPGWLVAGLYQPVPSQLSLAVGRQYLSSDLPIVDYRNYSPTPANIVIGTKPAQPAAEVFNSSGEYLFPATRNYELDLSPTLVSSAGSGFGIFRLDNSNDDLGSSPGFGNITIASGTVLALPVASSLSLAAANITIAGSTLTAAGAVVTAPSGAVSFTAYDVSPVQAERIAQFRNGGTVPEDELPHYDPDRGNIVVGSGATLNLAGALVDQRPASQTPDVTSLIVGGGSVTLSASNISLKPGSAVDVSGGGTYSAAGKLTYGSAGSIALIAGKAWGSGFGAVFGGQLNVTRAKLQGYSGVGGNGGSLSVQAPSVVIRALSNGSVVQTDPLTGALTLAPGFFDLGGFSSFSATGVGVAVGTDGTVAGTPPAFLIASGTVLRPRAQSWQTSPGEAIYTAQDGLRTPVRLAFNSAARFSDATGEPLFNDVSVTVDTGAVIATDPGGSVSFNGGAVDILGSVAAHGGKISVTQNSQANFLPTIHLGSKAVLDASGDTTWATDFTGYHKADVLDGGTITIDGNIVAETGAVLNVSGASDTVYLAPGDLTEAMPPSPAALPLAVVKNSNGGRITLTGEQMLFTNATLLGGPGVPAAGGVTNARGGDLVIGSNRALIEANGSQPGALDPVLIVTASAPIFSYNGFETQVTNAGGSKYGDSAKLGLLWFGADSFNNRGFGALTLAVGQDTLQVRGNVAISASRQITVADGGLLSLVADPAAPAAGSGLSLSAPYVVLGRPFQGPLQADELSSPFAQSIPSTNGAGTLTVHASSLIDVGNLSLQNVSSVLLDATNNGTTTGAIRGDGTLDVAGDITLKAGQIYPPTAVTFNVIANDHTVNTVVIPGSVTIQSGPSGTPLNLPLSAGGTLNIYASNLTQGGVLRAPLGTINLGATADSGSHPFSGLSLPASSNLTLLPGSVTSVSALDPITGKPVTIPYGLTVNGDTWVDPAGIDITNLGPNAKSIALASGSIDFQANAKIDLAGGGDLFAYQFVPGTGGTSDILLGSTAGAFAVLPGYSESYAPFSAYDTNANAQISLGADPGYTIGNAKLSYVVGDRVHLEGGGGLPAGDYTLLPARYALLPGAFLVTPRTAALTAGAAPSVAQPDGSVVVAGYRFNGLDAAGKNQSLFKSFEVASLAVVARRAQYDNSTANAFFANAAVSNDTVAPRLPVDAGQLVMATGTVLKLNGGVNSQAGTGGRGSFVDISSSADIFLGSHAAIVALGSNGTPGTIVLDVAALNGFGAESLLIGGVRTTGSDGTTVAVNTNNITVDNAGVTLFGPDVILTANNALTLKDGAEVGKSGVSAITSDPLRINGSRVFHNVGDTLTLARGGTAISLPEGTPGNGLLTSTSSGTITDSDGTTTTFHASIGGTNNAFSVPAGATITLDSGGTLTFASTTDTEVKSIALSLGDGALLRVGSDPDAQIVRTGVAAATNPLLAVGAGVKITGASGILDSTNTTNLDPSVVLTANSVSLDSGRVSVLLDQPGGLQSTGSLVLARSAQQSLLGTASSLSLLSYSTLDFYGTGTFGSATLGALGLHAGAIRGYTNSADSTAAVTVAAKTIQLDNNAGAVAPSAAGTQTGLLTLNTGTLTLGDNQLQIQNYNSVTMNATGGVQVGDARKLSEKSGGLDVVGGDLLIKTPLVAGTAATTQTIAADGRLSIQSANGTATVTPGMAASLNLTGASVELGTEIKLPSGRVTVEATTGDLTITNGNLDVSGTARNFFDLVKYTDGGIISLTADLGNLSIGTGSKILVSAEEGGGSAGTLTIANPLGTFAIASDALIGEAGEGGRGGSFNLDASRIPGSDPAASHLSVLNQALADGGFTSTISLRVREGDIVADGTVRAHDYTVSADYGSITVTGSIDASGLVGSSRANPQGGKMDAADPTGGSIDLSASGSVTLTSSAWLSATGYVYDNAGKGGAISLSAGSYVYRGGVGQTDSTGIVSIQSGAQIDLGVVNQFTAEDLALNSGATPPASTRTDLFTGTLHLRESQSAFGSGAQFASIGSSVNGASGIVLEGFQVFDLTGTNGAVSTSGSVTSIGSGGLINSTVENAVKANGTAFAAAGSPALAGNPLFHVRPGAEVVNNAAVSNTVTRNFVTLTSSATATRSAVNFNLLPGNGIFTTALIPGGLPVGLSLRTTTGRQFTLTTADGVTSAVITANANTTIASAAASNPVVAINFRNTSGATPSTQLNFFSGITPFTVAFNAGTTITSTSTAGRYSSYSGDLALANTWDLSTFRFGTRNEPGHLSLRAKGNLVLGFDASLSDGFDPANPVIATYPLWTAKMMSGSSWSYRLVGGADYSAANSQTTQPLGTLDATSGSVLLGKGGLALPTATGNTVTRSAIIPRYYQTIRTGTGDIEISAGRDVQLLNPLATIYTAGSAAATLANFDVPVLNSTRDALVPALTPAYLAQYGLGGGNLTVRAGNDVVRYREVSSGLVADSAKELPTSWLYRRGNVGADGNFVAFTGNSAPTTEVQSTSWWIDYSNFFDDVATLGGGNVSLSAGRNVSNVSASAATNARMSGNKPDSAKLLEIGGGNLFLQAGGNIDGGVYYVERGDVSLRAAGEIKTNATRVAFSTGENVDLLTWLPTTFFLGKGMIDVVAVGDVRIGQVANPFWLPQGANNRTYESTYFSTLAATNAVSISSLNGAVTVQGQATEFGKTSNGSGAWLMDWYANVLSSDPNSLAATQPWLRLSVAAQTGAGLDSIAPFQTVAAIMPGTFRAVAFSGDINLIGTLTLAPAAKGTLDLLAAGNINGLQPNGTTDSVLEWRAAAVNVSDADPARLPGITTPISFAVPTRITPTDLLASVDALFSESGRTNFSLEEKLALHAQVPNQQGQLAPLHFDDRVPAHLYAAGGDVSGLTLYSPKPIQLVAANDVTDIGLYVQNLHSDDVTLVSADRDVVAYAPASALRSAAQKPGNLLIGTLGATGPSTGNPNTGDIQISGPGTVEVLAGRNLVLGSGSNATLDGTAAGLTSVGGIRNPYLPQDSGADIVAAAGMGGVYSSEAAAVGLTPGLATTRLKFSSFIGQFLDPDTAGVQATRYLPVLGSLMGLAGADPGAIWAAFDFKPDQPVTERQARLVLAIFNRVLRNAARDRNDRDNPDFGTYTNGFAAIAALFPGSPQPTDADLKSTVPVVRPAGPWAGNLSLSTREIKTFEGGSVTLLAPGGNVTVGRPTDPQKPDQGVLTERGGAISMFAADNVNVGTSRIFTLRGGDEVIWSTWGNIAAGSGSKTVFSAPPTRVLIDPQSGDVQNDLAGLATGSGIGVLATLAGVKPGDVDLIAPVGTIDAGDAGIRSSGNLNVAARVVLNASNIQVGGTSSGTPPPPPAPNLGSLTAASSASAAASSAANDVAKQNSGVSQATELPSLFTAEVLGYGGGEGDDEDSSSGSGDDTDEKRKKKKKNPLPEGTR